MRVRIDFVQFLRETRKFSGPGELVAQLGRDRETALAALDRLAAGDDPSPAATVS
jgi:FAD synthase